MAIRHSPVQEEPIGAELLFAERIRTLASTRVLLTIIFSLAVLLRVGSALYQGNTVTALPGIYDQMSYHELAIRVAQGHGFSFAEGHWPVTPANEPTAHWSYLYTLYLAGVYSLAGVQPILARLLQAAVAGVLHTWLAYRIGRRVFGPTTGLFAALFSAVYIYFVYYAGGLLTETLYFVAILWTLDASLRLASATASEIRWSQWLALGLAIATTVLLRQVFLIFVPILFLWLWWNVPLDSPAVARSAISRLRLRLLPGLILAGIVLIAAITPFTVRNYKVFGTFVPLNTNAGFAFYWGNHPIHGTSFIPLLPGEGTPYQDIISPELLALNEGQLDRALLQEALEMIQADPGRFFVLSLSRTREYFKFWPSSESPLLSNVARVGSFGLFLPFMLYGLWLAGQLARQPQHVGQRAQIILLLMFILVYAGIHLLTWTLVRYRLPIDTVLLIFAALAIARIAAVAGIVRSTA